MPDVTLAPFVPKWADAWVDDGHESGAARVRSVAAELVCYPFREGNYRAEVQGSAAITYQGGGFTANPEGLPRSLTIGVPAGTGNGARIYYPFHGRAFGVRWQSFNTVPDFSVVVDGEAVRVPGWLPQLADAGITTQVIDSEAALLTHDNLDRGRHLAEIVVVAPPTGTTTLQLFGVLLDRGAGYAELPRVQHTLPPADVPTSLTALTITSGSSAFPTARGVRGIIYTNTTGGALTVTLQYNSVQVWKKSIPADDSVTFDPLGLTNMLIGGTAGFAHIASGSGLKYTPILGY